MSNVLHGEGEPRIVLYDAENKSTLSVTSSDYYSVMYSGNIKDDVENRQAISVNNDGDTTTAKILSVNTQTRRIFVDEWSNELPKELGTLTIENRVIDLPNCNEPGIDEYAEFELSGSDIKTFKKTGRKDIDIIGVYHFIRLDFTEYIPYDVLTLMQPIYDFSRTEKFTVYPHKDNMNVGYLCEINPSEIFKFKQLMGKEGMQLVSFNFIGLELLPKIDLTSNKSTLKVLRTEDGAAIPTEDGTPIYLD